MTKEVAMSFFDEPIGENDGKKNDAIQENITQKETPLQGASQADILNDLYPNKTADTSEKDFWEGFYIPPKKVKRGRLNMLLSCAVGLLLIFCGFGIAVVSVRGQGWLSNLITGEKHISFTLPLSEKPKADEGDMDKDGKYTTNGLAKNFSDTVVSIEIFSNKSNLIPDGQGSGIIMTENGYIVTNAHVVDPAKKGIKVVLNNGDEYEAKVIGSDSKSDIAVIKIPASNLQTAEFGDSSQVEIGEEIVAIGSPAGYYGSVTKGIVSGLNRNIVLENSIKTNNCIQIDAAINPGNSGGALFNMYGQVIGITSSKLVSETYEGIGFAISTEEAKPIIEDIMEKGFVSGRVKIGITFYNVSKAAADINEVKPGLCVVSVDKNCDVANTELAPGDIITKIDGIDVSEKDADINGILQKHKADDEITCEVYRKGYSKDSDTFEIKFKLMEDNGGLAEVSSEAE